jgi:hypothetical protein
LGYELYVANALNLAMSIKADAPEVSITLIHDDTINTLTEKEKTFFDILKPAKKEDFFINGKPQYQRLKICVDEYSDYEETLYVDVDSIWFPGKNIKNLFDAISEREFLIGYNGHYNPFTRQRTNKNYTYWIENPATACSYFGLKNNLPQTISGTFYFKKGNFSEQMFKIAREVYDDPNAPHIRWGGGKPDEYCFNIALSKLNYSQEELHFLYFDKVNGAMPNEKIFQSFWGLAAGGNKLQLNIKRLYNDLVSLYSEHFEIQKHYHVDKKTIIPERLANV